DAGRGAASPRLNNWRTLTRIARREALGPESSFIKLFWSEMSQRMHDTLMDLLGPAGLCWQPGPQAIAGGRLSRSYLYYRAASLFAGSSELQRNILAERVLGLPRGRGWTRHARPRHWSAPVCASAPSCRT